MRPFVATNGKQSDGSGLDGTPPASTPRDALLRLTAPGGELLPDASSPLTPTTAPVTTACTGTVCGNCARWRFLFRAGCHMTAYGECEAGVSHPVPKPCPDWKRVNRPATGKEAT